MGSYSDASVACDKDGNIYVSEALVGRLRRLTRNSDATWNVRTIAGGGSQMPTKGQSIPATAMKFGCSSRFALTPDGTIYFANWGGIYQIKGDQATCLADVKQLKADLGERASIHDWHVGGSHITPDGMFYWMPGGGPDIYRFDTKTGKAERFAGIRRTEQGLDGPTLLESGFHTVLVGYRPDASVIYTCGGDESVPRRIKDGKVMSLNRDGIFRPFDKKAKTGGRDPRWTSMAAIQCLDSQGRLYLFTGDYGWGGWVVRFTFARED